MLDQNPTLDGKSLRMVTLGGESLSGNPLAFFASFTDNSRAIYVATIAEPATCALLAWPD